MTMLLALLGASSSSSPEVFVSGVSATGQVGFAASQGGITTSVAGVSASALVRPVSQSLGATVFVNGVQASGAVANVEAGQPAVLPAGTILLFDRTSESDPVPSGFSLYTEESGGTIVNYLIKGGSSVSRVTGTSQSISIAPQTVPLASNGAHILSSIAIASGGTPQTGAGGDTPAGAHTHTLTVASVSAPFPTTGSNQGVSVPLVRCSSDVPAIPPKCVVFSGTSSVFTNFTRKSWGVSLGTYSASSTANINRPSPTNIAPSFSPAFSVSFSGAHFHPSPTAQPSTSSPSPGPLKNNGAYNTGSHDHTAQLTFVGVWKQFKHLLPMTSSTEQFVQPGMIVMYNGVSVPSGWKLCDGTNGTPNMIDFFLGYDNASSSSDVVVGRDTVGSFFPSGPQPQPYGQTSIPFSIGNNPWSHFHAASIFESTPVSVPSSTSRNIQHGSSTVPHNHTSPSIVASIPSGYIPAHLTLIFIQKA